MVTLTTGQMRQILEPYHVALSDADVVQFCKYLALLLHWNRTLNLTASNDPEEIAARHFGESIFASQVASMSKGRLADVGTGAGFPAVPLKIVCPRLELTLLEPNAKKCAFLTDLTLELALQEVTIVRSRYEDYDPVHGQIDFLSSRALGRYKDLLRWSPSVLKIDGRVILWLGAEDALLVSRSPGWSWDPPVPIPGSRRRVILTGTLLRPRFT